MFWWLSDASTWASRLKRASRSGSRSNACGRIFRATSRLSRVSRPRYTSPVPPAPGGARISYGPSFVPDGRDIYRELILWQELDGDNCFLACRRGAFTHGDVDAHRLLEGPAAHAAGQIVAIRDEVHVGHLRHFVR